MQQNVEKPFGLKENISIPTTRAKGEYF